MDKFKRMVLVYDNDMRNWRPKYEKDIPLFKHFADGMIACTQAYLDTHVLQIGNAHDFEFLLEKA